METTTRVPPPHPKRFFIHNTTVGAFVRVKGHSVTVPGMEEFDLFVHSHVCAAGEGVTLTEGKTGGKLLCLHGQTEAQLLRVAAKLWMKKHKKRLNAIIETSVKATGLSPRWTP